MPLSQPDRVKRQVLGHLLFHERSPVPVVADPSSCTRFDCPSPVQLAAILTKMAEAGLFRVVSPLLRPSLGEGGKAPRSPGDVAPLADSDFLAGVSVMITAEGKRTYAVLKNRTREIRQEDWQDEQGKVEPGTWVRSDA